MLLSSRCPMTTATTLNRSRFGGAVVGLLLVISTCSAEVRESRIIDLRGQQIPSIFYGVQPNARIASVYSRLNGGSRGNSRSCSIQKTVFHETDQMVRLLTVSACQSHYMMPETRNCGSCLGGSEDWVYVDSLQADYCDGYDWDNMGCDGMCREEEQCWNDNEPTCQ